MLKHVGRHGDEKVVVVFREVPNEDHMCLVMYPEFEQQKKLCNGLCRPRTDYTPNY